MAQALHTNEEACRSAVRARWLRRLSRKKPTAKNARPHTVRIPVTVKAKDWGSERREVTGGSIGSVSGDGSVLSANR
jgi:hypothetical protein